jgi:multicomponent Na+:H+ antiporter subunit G
MDLIVVFFLICGLVFFTGGAVGILRFPDFYSRLHPAGKLDTMGSLLMMIGLALFNLHHFSLATALTSIKIILIVVFVFLSSPTAIHGIVDAGVRAGLGPWTKEE